MTQPLGNGLDNRVQILDEVVCISHLINTRGKYMNPAMSK